MLKQERVEEGDLAEVLRKEEDLVVGGRVRELSVTLQETIRRRHLKVELESGQNAELHLKDILFGELILGNMQKIFKLRRVNLFIFGSNQE